MGISGIVREIVGERLKMIREKFRKKENFKVETKS